MSSKRRIRKRGCFGKVKYTDRKQAKKAYYKIEKDILKKYGVCQKYILNIYKCKNCGFYHLGRLSLHSRKMIELKINKEVFNV